MYSLLRFPTTTYMVCYQVYVMIATDLVPLGVVQLLFWPLFLGISTIILPKFNPEDFCAAIERYKVTTAFIVPPIVLALVHHPGMLASPNRFSSRLTHVRTCSR